MAHRSSLVSLASGFLLASIVALAASTGCSSAQGGDATPALDPADETVGADESTAESVVGTVTPGTHLKTTADLRLRNGPSTSNAILLVMPAGSEVTAVDGAPSHGWYHVDYKGHVGWSYGAYLDRVGSTPPPSSGGLQCSHLQWWNSYITYQSVDYGWHDTDLGVSHGTPVQLRHASRLDKYGTYGWGYMPEFTDLVTGDRFRFLHLLPQDRWATNVGHVYEAGTVVGLSGGDTKDTGLGVYSTGAHLCVQTLASYRSAFPSGHDTCH